MLRRLIRTIRFAALLLKTGGITVFIQQMRRQVYSHDVLIALEKELDEKILADPCKLMYSLRPASPEDFQELRASIAAAGKDSAHELVQRVWFYESGFRNCYIARTADTGEICHLQWLLSPDENDVVNKGFGSRLPRIKEEEILIENVYTPEKFRRNGLLLSVTAELCELARNQGSRRIVVHVRKNNNSAMEGYTKIGFKEFEVVQERKLLFHTRRTHSPVEPQLVPGYVR